MLGEPIAHEVVGMSGIAVGWNFRSVVHYWLQRRVHSSCSTIAGGPLNREDCDKTVSHGLLMRHCAEELRVPSQKRQFGVRYMQGLCWV